VIPDQKFYFMEKILYKKEGVKGTIYGEYEVDYVFLGKLDSNIHFKAIPAEVEDTAWVAKDQMDSFIDKVVKEGGYLSPWFLKMHESHKLLRWW
jgi:isopentenyldiphosphate isomerase